MAKGDIYDNKEYVWQVRALTDGTFMIRYDTNISSINKGRYNTSSIVSISVTDDVMTVTTKSGRGIVHYNLNIHYYSDVRYILPLASLAIVHSQYISAG